MNKNRKSLYLHSTILRGRLLRSPGEEGGATGDGIADNAPGGQGNSGGASNSGGDSNNTGDQLDPEAFWKGPEAAPNSAPSGESAANPPAASGTGEQNDFGTQLTAQLATLKFGDPVMTPEVAEQINAGDFTGFQTRIDASMQQAVRQSLAMNVQILKPFAEQLMSQMREEFGQTLTGRDNEDTLIRDFPAAKNPAAAPMIRQVYAQALKNTRGDRTKAVQQTKSMLSMMAGVTAGDLNLDVAPRGPGDSGRPANPTTNWLDELTGRK